jgi:hypothetical protein
MYVFTICIKYLNVYLCMYVRMYACMLESKHEYVYVHIPYMHVPTYFMYTVDP